MQISVQFDQPFTGIVHVKNFRRDPCQIYGNGSTSLSLTIDLLAGHNRPNYCGVYRTKGSEERSISLVVRLHRALELSDDKHFVITCGNTEFNNRNRNEKLLLKFVDQNGNKINKLYHGESYRLRAEIVSSSSSSQNQQLSSSRSSSSSSSSPSLSSYHLYVHNCFIFNGNDSDVEFLDSNGCPALTSVGPFKQISRNVAESDIQSMFKLPGTNQLHLQCLIKMIENCTTCQQSFCPINQTRSQSQELISSKKNNAKTKTEMQMLASTTVYVFEPDQQMSSSILYAGGIGGGLGFNGGGNNGHNFDGRCTEWRFPWLIALCIMLGILLIIMMVVNIFLCSSLSCSCCRSEIVEHEPVIIEDYDPYKIDIGSFYSPYDSRLSLNRSSKLLPFSSSSSTAHHNCGNGGGVCPGVCSNHDRSGHYCSSAHQTQSVLSLPAPQSTQSHQSSSSSSQNQQHQQQQQQQQQHSQHHHHHHNNQNHPLMPLTANSSTAIKPISISSSYSPSIETTNNNNSNLRGRLLMNGLNGNNLKINKSNLKKLGKSASKQTKQLGKQSMMMMMPPAIAYNPYQHSPQSIRSEEFY
ncbi:hypothetical protein SSS_04216 [Sarcoptes scabiei]|uniref:ZP domain-containing protein n=1 Tax=Sarcoptes scabiei TaxID=52283 RepID=A0A834R4U4_SARSC|nr:hypothetical protein SSS_04216 [Sarcoptes scabiei]